MRKGSCTGAEGESGTKSALLDLTFLQLVHGGDLARPIDGEDEAHALWQVDVVREGAREVGQQGVEGAEAVGGHSVDDALEVAVAVAVETHLLGLLLIGEGLECARAVEAAVGTVGGAWKTVHTTPLWGPGRLVSLVKVAKVQLHGGRVRGVSVTHFLKLGLQHSPTKAQWRPTEHTQPTRGPPLLSRPTGAPQEFLDMQEACSQTAVFRNARTQRGPAGLALTVTESCDNL
ncbi:hypothetical protein JZ751_023238 [Albula glossodonta]|uniref:Uncharacterized protein n=1 Tax=Albula glossodonta TaxID=121402 RepID=A0A8T2PNH1_9TELE|nr:hypothetical protein JZ751_023238 [Albula glossodonta]